MAEGSKISWTQNTWNPWQGCTKVSPACAHCYMFRDKERYGQDPTVVVRSARPTFTLPLRWKEPALVFTCSWSDWFHETADPWRDEAWDIVRRTPHLTYQILTKRPERIVDHLPADWGKGYPNVWLGTSVENQRWTSRIPILLAVPAQLHWISAEPLLGPLDLTPWLCPPMRVSGAPSDVQPALRHPVGDKTMAALAAVGRAAMKHLHGQHFLEWVVVGGESGSRFRAPRPEWITAVRDQCVAAGVPFHFKQWGGKTPDAGGRLLEGREWNELPEVVAA